MKGRYPKDLPEIPIYNSRETCVNCEHVWLDIDGDPDSNHCVPMVSPEYSLETLTLEQKEKYLEINETAQCPLYDPRSDKGPSKLERS